MSPERPLYLLSIRESVICASEKLLLLLYDDCSLIHSKSASVDRSKNTRVNDRSNAVKLISIPYFKLSWMITDNTLRWPISLFISYTFFSKNCDHRCASLLSSLRIYHTSLSLNDGGCNMLELFARHIVSMIFLLACYVSTCTVKMCVLFLNNKFVLYLTA